MASKARSFLHFIYSTKGSAGYWKKIRLYIKNVKICETRYTHDFSNIFSKIYMIVRRVASQTNRFDRRGDRFTAPGFSAIDQKTVPEELPVSGDPYNETTLELIFPGRQPRFKLNGKKLQLLEPLDRDDENLSHVVFQVRRARYFSN